ncbi:MAG: DUF2637 domain-containing protein [Promicromonosporaceae bacterium]|nr:DUF2637 domain-containing protein [Promicromonosporaceae bacterium]
MSTRHTAQIHPDTLPVLIVATMLTAGLAAVSFALSYSALVRIASWAAVPDRLAWAIPVMLDSAILVYSLAALVKRSRRERAAGAWASLALWTAVSVAANAAHAAGVPETWQRAVGTVVAALAPVAVLLATHTIADLIVAPAPDADNVARPVAASATDEPMNGRADEESDTDDDEQDGGRPASAVVVQPSVVRVHRPRPAGRASDCREDIVRLRGEGLSVRAIAERVGLGKTAVADYLRTLDTVAA